MNQSVQLEYSRQPETVGCCQSELELERGSCTHFSSIRMAPIHSSSHQHAHHTCSQQPQTVKAFSYCSVKETDCSAVVISPKSFVVLPFLSFFKDVTFFLMSLFCFPGMCLHMDHLGWQNQDNGGCQWPRFIPLQRTGISIRTCPLLRTWIMLSVHWHRRSWNDRANEQRAGRWAQDPLSLNQLTSRLLCGGKWRFTGYEPHGILILQLCIICHVHWSGCCNMTTK